MCVCVCVYVCVVCDGTTPLCGGQGFRMLYALTNTPHILCHLQSQGGTGVLDENAFARCALRLDPSLSEARIEELLSLEVDPFHLQVRKQFLQSNLCVLCQALRRVAK